MFNWQKRVLALYQMIYLIIAWILNLFFTIDLIHKNDLIPKKI